MITADIMSRPVIAVGPDAPLAQAVRLMVDNRVSGLPVIDADGCVVGMLTEGDLLRRVETGTEDQAPGWFVGFFIPGRRAAQYILTHGRLVSEVMTPNVLSVTEGTPLLDVVGLMQRKRIKRLPVVRGDRMVGIVSRADLVRVVADALGTPAATANDASIRQAILDELDHQAWAPKNGISIAVEKGVVLLEGCLFDLRERDAMGVIAENAPGVRRVENRIVCIEPNTGMLIYDPGDEPTSTAADQTSH